MTTLNEALTEYDALVDPLLDNAMRGGMELALVRNLRKFHDEVKALTISGHQQTHRQAIAENPKLINWDTVRAVCFDGFTVHCNDDGRLVLSDNNGWTQAATPRQALIVLGVLQREILAA